jgi:hypothetical protein
MIDKDTLEAAHRKSVFNRSEVARGDLCGCFCCLKTFKPDEIRDYTDKEPRKGRTFPDQTPLCPFCGIDAVLGSESGYPLTDEFLGAMKRYWFDRSRLVTEE